MQVLGNPGLGFPASDPDDGLQPVNFVSSPGTINTRFENCTYWNVSPELLWDASTVSLFDVANANFTPRAPIVNVFSWETGTITHALSAQLNSPPGETTGANTLANAPVFTGSLGAGVYPTGWTNTGTDATCNTTINDGPVNGISTNAARIRMTAAGGYQGLEHSFAWTAGQKCKISAWLRIPGVAVASDCRLYFGGAPFGFASAAQLNAQPKNVWVLYETDYTPATTATTFISFMNPADATGTGWDLALPQIQPYIAGSGGAIATASPVIGSPALAIAMATVGIATASPVIGPATLTIPHYILEAAPLSTSSPVLGPVNFIVSSHAALEAAPFSTSSPVIGPASLKQRHNLAALPLTTRSPVLGPAALGSIALLKALARPNVWTPSATPDIRLVQSSETFPRYQIPIDWLLLDRRYAGRYPGPRDGGHRRARHRPAGEPRRHPARPGLRTDRAGWWGDIDAKELFNGWPIGSSYGCCAAPRSSARKTPRARPSSASKITSAKRCSRSSICRIATSFDVEAHRVGRERIDATVVMYRGPTRPVELRFQILWNEIERA